jgi:hypothetical protein
VLGCMLARILASMMNQGGREPGGGWFPAGPLGQLKGPGHRSDRSPSPTSNKPQATAQAQGGAHSTCAGHARSWELGAGSWGFVAVDTACRYQVQVPRPPSATLGNIGCWCIGIGIGNEKLPYILFAAAAATIFREDAKPKRRRRAYPPTVSTTRYRDETQRRRITRRRASSTGRLRCGPRHRPLWLRTGALARRGRGGALLIRTRLLHPRQTNPLRYPPPPPDKCLHS